MKAQRAPFTLYTSSESDYVLIIFQLFFSRVRPFYVVNEVINQVTVVSYGVAKQWTRHLSFFDGAYYPTGQDICNNSDNTAFN